MNAKANKTLIGAFIIGALALAVAGIILFSSVGYFSQRPEYVMYFEGSVKGLYEGAPVVFRGVRIGSVKNISLHFDPDDASVRIPVQVQLDPQPLPERRAGRLRNSTSSSSSTRSEGAAPASECADRPAGHRLDFYPTNLLSSWTRTASIRRFPLSPRVSSSLPGRSKTSRWKSSRTS